tara:strand:+ start:644 stop:943 length:300 start_codon:yes stop_codon:yes gene_type:complete
MKLFRREMKKLLLLLCLILAGCEIYGSARYTPYRPSLDGHYELHFEVCEHTMPYAVEYALICDEACCIWEAYYGGHICEETWCCDSYNCEWFLHYEDCY